MKEKLLKFKKYYEEVKWFAYLIDSLIGILLLGISTGLNYSIFFSEFDNYNCIVIYIFFMIILSAISKFISITVIYGIASILLFNFCYIPPVGSLDVDDYRTYISFLLMLLTTIGIAITGFYTRKKNKEAIEAKEKYIQLKYDQENEHSRLLFLESVSHDIKTPLSSIISASELLQNEQLNSHQCELLNIISQKSNSIAESISNILLLTKVEHLNADNIKHETIPIEDIIDVSLENLESIVENRKIKIDLDEENDIIEGDFTLLTILFTNILANAIKFTDKDKGIIKINSRLKDDLIEINFKNNGPHIKEEDLTKIFKLFYTKSKSGDRDTLKQGTGIGLAICKEICRLHNSEIIAKNTDFGVEFSIFLKKENPNVDNLNR